MPFRIGCDIGGTFTDFILLNEDTGELSLEKVLTTPADPSLAVLDGCKRLSDLFPEILDNVAHVIHGTTLVINAVLERSGAKTALVTTRGFRDVLEMRRYMRADMYDVFGDLPEPVVSRDLRFEVCERTSADGTIRTTLDERSVREVAARLRALDIESVAVCLLHSYRNPEHERSVAKILLDECPEIAISLSSDVLPQISEYERTSSTAINAYVKPLAQRYLDRMQTQLKCSRITDRLFLMLSGGGITSVETAIQFPVRLVESGPVAGVIAASHFGTMAGARDVLSFDMGGTTAKASLIQDGHIPIATDYEIDRSNRARRGSGLPISLPSVDIIEVGTGGGSIAYIDALGLVRVGPRSAGADPGPAAYARGGTEPTVSDADLVLGYLAPDSFLGGTMRLDRQAAERAIEQRIAIPLGMSVVDAAWGIIDVAREQMASAMRMQIAERAGDPGRTTIVASGGAGPVHAAGLMSRLRAKRMVVPAGAGVMSAIGMLMAPISYNLVRTWKSSLDATDPDALAGAFGELEADVASVLRSADSNGEQSFLRSVDMRYVGQGHELTIPLDSTAGSSRYDLAKLREAFQRAYLARYGYASVDAEIEIVTIQVRGYVDREPLVIHPREATGVRVEIATKGDRPAFDPVTRSFVPHTIYDRYLLEPGMTFSGPAIVEERESTLIVPGGCSSRVDDFGSLIVEPVDSM